MAKVCKTFSFKADFPLTNKEMTCQNLLIVDGEVNVPEFLRKLYSQKDLSFYCQDASTYKFESDDVPDKTKMIRESENFPGVKFIISFFYVKDNHYVVGYFSVLNGKIGQEKLWDNTQIINENNGFNYAFNFVSRFYPLLVKDVFVC